MLYIFLSCVIETRFVGIFCFVLSIMILGVLEVVFIGLL